MLYNDMRPDTLEKVYGNEGTISALKTLFEAGPENAPQVYLFHGPSGTGKTTLARIVQKMIGCDEVGLTEVNAADSRGIDTVRELIAMSRVSPLSGRARFIVLDEAHMLTKPAQNALLKAIEDVVPGCYWAICTTEPGGIIPTIRTRCTSLETSLLRTKAMGELIDEANSRLCDDPLEDELRRAIIDAAEGSARRALVILEKVMFIDDLDAAIGTVKSELQESARPEVIELCRLLVSRVPDRFRKAQALLPELVGEPEKVRITVANYLGGCLLRENDLERVRDLSSLLARFLTPWHSPSAKANLIHAVLSVNF